MRSWILRHRLRLRLIYGPGLAPAPAVAETGGTAEPHARAHGRLRRSADGLELVPMPRRVRTPRRVG